jgi:hypothetical protein
MLLIPNALFTEYVAHLNKMKIPVARFTEYKKWLRYYLRGIRGQASKMAS